MIARHLTATAPMLSDRHQVIEPGTGRRGIGQRAASVVVQGSVSKNFNRAPSRLPTGKPQNEKMLSGCSESEPRAAHLNKP